MEGGGKGGEAEKEFGIRMRVLTHRGGKERQIEACEGVWGKNAGSCLITMIRDIKAPG